MIVHWMLVRLRLTVAHYVSLSDQVSKSDTSQATYDCCCCSFCSYISLALLAQALDAAVGTAFLSDLKGPLKGHYIS